MRNKYYKFMLHCPDKIDSHSIRKDGNVNWLSVEIQTGSFQSTFEAEYTEEIPGYSSDSINLRLPEINRGQLRQIADAHQAVFYMGKNNAVTLREDDLAQIRSLLAYTDTLPDYDPVPPGFPSQ